ncbi:MAG TPA: FtsX-like permease family protein [Burkholderiaceae bacterium]|jgi:putative ABC transport system permease protein
MEIRPILSVLLRGKVAPLLVALQVAISLAVLTNALYIVNLRYEAANRSSGIADESAMFMIHLSPVTNPGFADIIAQQQRDRETLAALPGVQAVAWVNQMPMTRSGWNTSVATERNQAQPTATVAQYESPDSMIKTLGLNLVEGREFNADEVDEVDTDKVDLHIKKVIVTQALAQALYPGAASVVGKKMFFGIGADADEAQIIGVVQRLQTPGAATGNRGEFSTIAPVRTSAPAAQFAVRVDPAQRDRVMRDAEAALRKITPYPVVVKVKSLDEIRADRYRDDRTLAWMLIAVSALLLLVTASGIVGMTTLWISQRRKQIGVRRALGARRVDILRYFITENVLITSGGVVAGLILAVGLNQILVAQLEMSKMPIGYLAAGSVLLWLLGVLAVFGPARRASKISPAIATRAA